eukprot:gnl/Trimastix_PCT/1393.p1 GENE.gnl/Trimastix_PCT/1393~~gnl/Trimastix_PCT/1393.p1  ORF type:complete len:612 (+),score=82.33 gnl/Trimastix_PCT/1393:68-1903(+)
MHLEKCLKLGQKCLKYGETCLKLGQKCLKYGETCLKFFLRVLNKEFLPYRNPITGPLPAQLRSLKPPCRTPPLMDSSLAKTLPLQPLAAVQPSKNTPSSAVSQTSAIHSSEMKLAFGALSGSPMSPSRISGGKHPMIAGNDFLVSHSSKHNAGLLIQQQQQNDVRLQCKVHQPVPKRHPRTQRSALHFHGEAAADSDAAHSSAFTLVGEPRKRPTSPSDHLCTASLVSDVPSPILPGPALPQPSLLGEKRARTQSPPRAALPPVSVLLEPLSPGARTLTPRDILALPQPGALSDVYRACFGRARAHGATTPRGADLELPSMELPGHPVLDHILRPFPSAGDALDAPISPKTSRHKDDEGFQTALSLVLPERSTSPPPASSSTSAPPLPSPLPSHSPRSGRRRAHTPDTDPDSPEAPKSPAAHRSSTRPTSPASSAPPKRDAMMSARNRISHMSSLQKLIAETILGFPGPSCPYSKILESAVARWKTLFKRDGSPYSGDLRKALNAALAGHPNMHPLFCKDPHRSDHWKISNSEIARCLHELMLRNNGHIDAPSAPAAKSNHLRGFPVMPFPPPPQGYPPMFHPPPFAYPPPPGYSVYPMGPFATLPPIHHP